jgi:hypothetical protein
MEGKRADDDVCERDSIDGGDYCGGHCKFRNGGDYGLESNSRRRHVKFADIYDYGFQCERYDDFANCDGRSAGEFHDCDGDSWRSVSWNSHIYGEWIADRSERVV